MKMKNQTLAVLFLAGQMTTALAYDYSVLQNSAIHANGGWSKTSNNGLSFGNVQQQPAIVGFPNFGVQKAVFAAPSDHFDGGLGYSYHFACTKARLFFHYDYFNDSDRGNSAQRLINLGIPPLPPPFTVALDQPVGFGIVHNRSNDFILGLDRRLDFGPAYHINTALFIEWGKVSRHFLETIAQIRENEEEQIRGTLKATRDTDNSFRGWGAGMGVKGHAKPFSCSLPDFGIFGSFMGSLLWGRNEYSSTAFLEVNNPLLATNGLIYSLIPEDTHSAVTKLDISLGIDYSHAFLVNTDYVQVGIAFGIRYINYINIFKNGNTFFNPIAPNAVPPVFNYALNTGSAEDWSRFGPFFQIRVGGQES